MILRTDKLNEKESYKLLIGTVLPRPIAWVSSMDEQGHLNLAPYSFFTVGSKKPMTLIFCPLVPGQAGSKKDTLRNIERVPEFVVNLTNESTAPAMNLTATNLPHGESEFEWAGVEFSRFVRRSPREHHAVVARRVLDPVRRQVGEIPGVPLRHGVDHSR